MDLLVCLTSHNATLLSAPPDTSTHESTREQLTLYTAPECPVSVMAGSSVAPLQGCRKSHTRIDLSQEHVAFEGRMS